MPSRQNTSTRRVEPRLKMSCQTLVSCASRPEAKDRETRRQVLDALVAGMVRRPRRHRVHLAEAEAQDVDVVDGVLNQAAAAGLGDVGPPLRRVGALNREVLVVAEDGRHRRAQRPAPHEVAQRPEDRRAAQHEAALAGHAARRPRRRRAPSRRARSRSSGFSQNTAQPAARASSTAPRWADVGVQTQTASQRAADLPGVGDDDRAVGTDARRRRPGRAAHAGRGRPRSTRR